MRVGLSTHSFGPRIFCAGEPAAPPKHKISPRREFFSAKLMGFVPASIWGRARGEQTQAKEQSIPQVPRVQLLGARYTQTHGLDAALGSLSLPKKPLFCVKT